MKRLKTLTGPDATAVPPEDRAEPRHEPEDAGHDGRAHLERRPNRGGDRDDAGPRWVA